MKDIQKLSEEGKGYEDYAKYSYAHDDGEVVEIRANGVARKMIDCLGEALLKESFLKFKK